MAVVTTALRHLIAAGVTGEQLIAAIAEIEAAQLADIHPQVIAPASNKSAAALRQERYRRNKASREASQSITNRNEASQGDVCDAARNAAPLPPSPPSPKPPHTPQEPQPPHPPAPANSALARKGDPFPCPEGVAPQHWQDFLANRKNKRLKNTPTAYAGILRDLEKFSDAEWPPGRVLQHAAERGWGGIYDPRNSVNGNTNGSANLNRGNHSGSTGLGRTAAAALAVFGPLDGGEASRAPEAVGRLSFGGSE